jgi:hypothetical protein
VPNVIPRVGPDREVMTRVRIARIEVRPTPTPTPTPPPRRPLVVSHARIIAPAETHVVANTTSGISARKEIVHRAGAARPKPPVFSHAKPVWDIPVGAQGAGAGKQSGAGSLGSGGAGTGAGDSGNGGGAAAGTEPCGFVEFVNVHGSNYDPSTHGFWVDIRMNVHYPDGHAESMILDYPFYYPSEASNPWSDRNRNNENFPTTFQSPPPDKRAGEPPLVLYVMAHSAAEGFTTLKDCPSAPSKPPE